MSCARICYSADGSVKRGVFSPYVFYEILLYAWILVNFHKNICTGVNLMSKFKAFNLTKQTPTRMVSWCPNILRAAFFWVSPNGWFSCIGRDFNSYLFISLLNSCFQTHSRCQVTVIKRHAVLLAFYFR